MKMLVVPVQEAEVGGEPPCSPRVKPQGGGKLSELNRNTPHKLGRKDALKSEDKCEAACAALAFSTQTGEAPPEQDAAPRSLVVALEQEDVCSKKAGAEEGAPLPTAEEQDAAVEPERPEPAGQAEEPAEGLANEEEALAPAAEAEQSGILEEGAAAYASDEDESASRQDVIHELWQQVQALEEERNEMGEKMSQLMDALINTREDCAMYSAEYDRIHAEGQKLYTTCARAHAQDQSSAPPRKSPTLIPLPATSPRSRSPSPSRRPQPSTTQPPPPTLMSQICDQVRAAQAAGRRADRPAGGGERARGADAHAARPGRGAACRTAGCN